MGTKNPLPSPDERVVYLSMKNLFKGQNAEIRKNKAIRQLIKRHQEQDSIATLMREHNLDVLCNLVQNLLSQRIFASTLEAKMRFPELFDPSPDQTAEQEASEAEAARHEADAMLQIVKVDQNGSKTSNNPKDETQVVTKGEKPAYASSSTPPPGIPQLFPIYLPFKAQHELLVQLQKALETACFEYGRREMPHVLKARGWDCPESVELNRWTDVLLRQAEASEQPGYRGRDIRDVLRSLTHLRHTAVHRLRVTAKAIEQFVLDAETLMMYLGEDEHAKTTTRLRRTIQTTIDELERNKYFLRSRLEETFIKIAAQRAKLQRQEQSAIEEMMKEDEEYQAIAGRMLAEVLEVPTELPQRDSSERSFSTALDTENEATEVEAVDTDDDVA